jgi:Coenzyme PQQ synthesis protein D (PqqD)
MNEPFLRPSSAVRAAASGDGLILLDVAGGLVLSANDVGARIWQLIEQHHTHDQIARQLADEFTIAVERARHDVRVFVAQLVARGLVAEECRE